MSNADSAHFTLYVTKNDRNQAISCLCAALQQDCFCPFDLAVVEVDSDPVLCANEHITCTPTLVCEGPGPRKVLSGDFSQLSQLREFLHRHS